MFASLVVLIVTTLSCVGLLAIAAVETRTYWFWRTIGFLGVAGLLLLVPAYEIFVLFVAQGVVAATFVQFARGKLLRGEKRFRLLTILLATVPVAIFSAICVRLPHLSPAEWAAIVATGMVSGWVTFLGWWSIHGQVLSWSGRLFVVFTTTVMLSWFFQAAIGMFLEKAGMEGVMRFFEYLGRSSRFAWTLILPSTLACVAIAVGLKRVSTSKTTLPVWSRVGGMVFIGVLLLMILPPAATYYQLLNPLPLPDHPLPEPNGYDDFLMATEMLPANSPANSIWLDQGPIAVDQLWLIVSELKPATAHVRRGLGKQVRKPMDYYKGPDLELLTEVSTLQKAFRAEGQLALLRNEPARAIQAWLESFEFASRIGRGGIIMDDLVAMKCMEVAAKDLDTNKERIPQEHYRAICDHIRNILAARESAKDVVYREEAWKDRHQGWTSHLFQIIGRFADEFDPNEFYWKARRKSDATLRLLQVEFALRAWHAEHGAWPDSLEQLVPEYLPAVPVDPFAEGSQPLQYRRTKEGFILYSIGKNGVDHGGNIEAKPNSKNHGGKNDGLRLDDYFGTEEE